MASPTSPTLSNLSIDRLEKERRSSATSEVYGFGADAVDGAASVTPTPADPNPVYAAFSAAQRSGGAVVPDALTAARAELEAIRREEEEVLRKLKAAELGISSGSAGRQYADNETVFNEDYENGTIIDGETGEVFGFGDGALAAVQEIDEVYGFGGEDVF